MKEELYLRGRTAIINFSVGYYKTAEGLLSSEGFSLFLKKFLTWLAVEDIEVYEWATRGEDLDTFVPRLARTARLLLVLEVEEIQGMDQMMIIRCLSLLEKGYDYWRRLERYTLIIAGQENSVQYQSFLDSDRDFNELVLLVYRTLEEKLQGRRNLVYRQMYSGSSGSVILSRCRYRLPKEYGVLKNVPMVDKVMLHTPMLLYPQYDCMDGSFSESEENPFRDFLYQPGTWICYPAKAGDLLIYVYFHQDFISNGVTLANLLELASREECEKRRPDGIVLYGNPDEKNRSVFYRDVKNHLWVGSLSYRPELEYFGYMKKMILTLHNLAKMYQGWLPVHGSMFNIYFKDHSKKSVVLIGETGAGKSETMEAVKDLVGDQIMKIDVVFDDMGTFHLGSDGKVYARGTEIGAFLRLDELEEADAYRDLARSVFLNPYSPDKARIVVPGTAWSVITSDQPIDFVLYANNYEDKTGMRPLKDIREAKEIFLRGRKRTKTGELADMYFANPYGPVQKQDLCTGIWNMVFGALYAQGVYVGEIYTHLALPGGKEGIGQAAWQLARDLQEEDHVQ